MRFVLHGLELECVALGRPTGTEPYDDWFWCEVRVRVPGFSGTFDWEVTVTELRFFLEELRRAEESVGTPQSIAFEALEPNVAFRLVLDEHGRILGEYHFLVSVSNGPELRGTFVADQTHLPIFRREFAALLAEAGVVTEH